MQMRDYKSPSSAKEKYSSAVINKWSRTDMSNNFPAWLNLLVSCSPNTRLVLEKGEYEFRLIDRNGNLIGISEMKVPQSLIRSNYVSE